LGLTHEELSEKIKDAQEKLENKTSVEAKYGMGSKEGNMIGKALRVGTEIVSAVLVGCLFGYWLDNIFNIAPFGMIFMVFMGFIASILNIYRLEEDITKRTAKK